MSIAEAATDAAEADGVATRVSDWIASEGVRPAVHDVRFTIGETVADGWLYTPPCVALAAWPLSASGEDAAFTTVSHWATEEWVEEPDGSMYPNDKRSGFPPPECLGEHSTSPTMSLPR